MDWRGAEGWLGIHSPLKAALIAGFKIHGECAWAMRESFAAFSGVHFGMEVKTTLAGADGFIRRFKRRSLRDMLYSLGYATG